MQGRCCETAAELGYNPPYGGWSSWIFDHCYDIETWQIFHCQDPLGKEADISVTSREGISGTVIQAAAFADNTHMIKLLLGAGADAHKTGRVEFFSDVGTSQYDLSLVLLWGFLFCSLSVHIGSIANSVTNTGASAALLWFMPPSRRRIRLAWIFFYFAK